MISPQCPYCGEASVFKRTSEMVYRKDFGPIYLCRNYPRCDAYVGVHKNTTTPLGRLANRELREAKKLAHAHFDPLWQAKIKFQSGPKGKAKAMARTAAYTWLAQQLCIDVSRCHIGEFDVEMCQKVVRICAPHIRRLGVLPSTK
jgi:hypothetical protein